MHGVGGPGWIRTTDRRIISPWTNPCLADEEVFPEVEYGIIPSSAERWCLEMLSFDVQNSKELCTSTTAVDVHRGRDWWSMVVYRGLWWFGLADSVA